MRVTKDVIKDTTRVTTTHTNRDGMTSTGFCTWSKQLSYIHTCTVTQMLGSHTNTITGTIRHNHKHETHTRTIPHSPQQQLTHRHTQAATVTETQGHTLSHLPTAGSAAVWLSVTLLQGVRATSQAHGRWPAVWSGALAHLEMCWQLPREA